MQNYVFVQLLNQKQSVSQSILYSIAWFALIIRQQNKKILQKQQQKEYWNIGEGRDLKIYTLVA